MVFFHKWWSKFSFFLILGLKICLVCNKWMSMSDLLYAMSTSDLLVYYVIIWPTCILCQHLTYVYQSETESEITDEGHISVKPACSILHPLRITLAHCFILSSSLLFTVYLLNYNNDQWPREINCVRRDCNGLRVLTIEHKMYAVEVHIFPQNKMKEVYICLHNFVQQRS